MELLHDLYRHTKEKHMELYDVAIIGAGVVGCAIARELKSEHWLKDVSVAIIEKNSGSGMGISDKSSGVLHSGLHHDPASLKAALAHKGSALAYQFCKDRNVPMLDSERNRGMLIAISSGDIKRGLWKEGSLLWHLWRRGKRQGIRFSFLTSRGIKKLEPHIKAAAGIYIPDVWVVDSGMFVTALQKSAELHKRTDFFFNRTVTGISRCNTRYVVTAGDLNISAKILINAAGLHADTIANMALGKRRYAIYPWRGEYYEIVNPNKRSLVNRLVYPAVPADSPGKGIHFSPRPDSNGCISRMLLGPNATFIHYKDACESDKTPAETFLKAANAFLSPEHQLSESDVRWAYSGTRPKLHDTPHEDDFIISVDNENPVLINLVGIESPGLSASMAIAETVCHMKSVYHALA